MRAVEQSVQTRNQRTVSRCIINGRCNHQSVGLLKSGRNFIYRIVNNAYSCFRAGSACNAAAHIFISDLENYRFNAFRIKGLNHLVYAYCRVSVHSGTSVNDYYFHQVSLPFRLEWFIPPFIIAHSGTIPHQLCHIFSSYFTAKLPR